jgi:hypothetical protein
MLIKRLILVSREAACQQSDLNHLKINRKYYDLAWLKLQKEVKPGYREEEKNWTRVRKVFGYLRYDAFEELTTMNDPYHYGLRLYKNFFQLVMKLKVRRG